MTDRFFTRAEVERAVLAEREAIAVEIDWHNARMAATIRARGPVKIDELLRDETETTGK